MKNFFWPSIFVGNFIHFIPRNSFIKNHAIFWMKNPFILMFFWMKSKKFPMEIFTLKMLLVVGVEEILWLIKTFFQWFFSMLNYEKKDKSMSRFLLCLHLLNSHSLENFSKSNLRDFPYESKFFLVVHLMLMWKMSQEFFVFFVPNFFINLSWMRWNICIWITLNKRILG
jgi:hypothetical protein